jgi:hypothetical protein
MMQLKLPSYEVGSVWNIQNTEHKGTRIVSVRNVPSSFLGTCAACQVDARIVHKHCQSLTGSVMMMIELYPECSKSLV